MITEKDAKLLAGMIVNFQQASSSQEKEQIITECLPNVSLSAVDALMQVMKALQNVDVMELYLKENIK